MKKIIYLVIFFIMVLFSSCNKSTEIDYENLIVGKWLCSSINEEAVITDHAFVVEFNSNKVQKLAKGYALSDGNNRWMEGDNYSYRLEDNILFINGRDALDSTWSLELEITIINDQSLTYGVRKITMGGKNMTDKNIYKFSKITNDNSSKIVGLWYGKNVTPGITDNAYHYWEYLANGQFYYYYFDIENSVWIKKEDNNGHYYTYGNFMATNYSNDIASGQQKDTYECWNITISGNIMHWTGRKVGNQLVKFSMERTSTPVPGFEKQ